ncbi:CpsB/CapC family capsule biosynthesis tyrosine phosphatase [Pedobacter sp. Du54]|uniref:tyrosine-protein phosphatase n=1 Tax=Pedobacter anseongensis TaxID=3133439 RepID=UPI0030B2D760
MLFFRKRSKNSDFSAIGTDMHSHLVPGVDDGAKDIADSINLVTGLKELGFAQLYTTPHTLQDIHPNTAETLQQGFSLLNGKLPEGISINLSSEYYLDEQFQGQVAAGAVLPLPGNRLLIEFSQIARPHDLEEQIFDLGIKGYQIILAHPERYLFFHKQFNYYTRIKEMGVELQVNALSLTDHYGKNIRAIAEKLIEKDMIDFIGTDIHHVKHLETLKQVPSSKFFTRLAESGLLKNENLIR